MRSVQLRQVSETVTQSLIREGIPPVLAKIYAGRGVTSAMDVHYEYGSLLPYRDLLNASTMARTLADAIDAGSKIVVLSDFDADGATGCAVAVRGLRGLGANVDWVVPDRLRHGYGLTAQVFLEKIQPLSPHWVLTVDNGIAAIDGIRAVKSAGIGVLVTDHHMPIRLPNGSSPDIGADCVVNPNQDGCGFGSKHLAGVGVIWYVLWALRDELVRRYPGREFFRIGSLLPFVAMGTVADVVSMADYNNRTLVSLGLNLLRKGGSRPAGIHALADVSKKQIQKLTTADFGYALAPRLNAAGRLEHMSAGVALLLNDDAASCALQAMELDAVNSARKQVQANIEADAEALVAEVVADGDTYDKFTIVAVGPWHPGVIGVAAGRLKEKYYRPTFVLSALADGTYKGSGRSIPGVNLKNVLDEVHSLAPHVMAKFGGHAMAAGLTLCAGACDEFTRLFEQRVSVALNGVLPGVVIEVDGKNVDPALFTPDVLTQMETGLWGANFPSPTFYGEFRVVSMKRMGADSKHLRMTLSSQGTEINAVQFFAESDPASDIRCVYQPVLNEYRGIYTPQLLISYVFQDDGAI